MTVNNGSRSESGLKAYINTIEGKKQTVTVLFLLVPLILLIVFTGIPAVNMLLWSFQSRDIYGANVEWVGMSNYREIFNTPEYFKPLANSLYYLAGSFVQQIVALFMATILTSKIRFANLFKGVLFFPWMINVVAVALIFRRFFQKGDGISNTDGTLNAIITAMGGSSVKFLSTEGLVNVCLVFVSIWRYIGLDLIMYMGAIQSISPEIYDAADIDGANGWERFIYIVAPSIRPIIFLQLIMAVSGAIKVYEIPYILTGGKFNSSTFMIVTTEVAFKYGRLGLASAMAVVLLIIIIIATIAQRVILKEDR